MHNTIVGVDLAKKVIQVCTTKGNKVVSNEEMTPSQFTSWLVNTKPVTVVFEACSTATYWKQVVLQASQLPGVSFINGKTFEQQELQSIMRMRELAVKHKVALRHQIESLLLEFNMRISPKSSGMKGVVQAILEDGENGFSPAFRAVLHTCVMKKDASLSCCTKDEGRPLGFGNQMLNSNNPLRLWSRAMVVSEREKVERNLLCE